MQSEVYMRRKSGETVWVRRGARRHVRMMMVGRERGEGAMKIETRQRGIMVGLGRVIYIGRNDCGI